MNQKQNPSSPFPPFPNNIIEGLAKEFVDLYSPIRETPDGFLWLAFVTYFGNLISPYVRLDCVSSEPRIFGVTIGKSGRTRKSAGNNAALDLFLEVVGDLDWQKVVQGFGSAEGMLVFLEKYGKERIAATLHLDEINILAAKTDITGSAGIAALHKLFDGHDYDHPLAKGGYFVKGAYLSLIGASTLEDFTKTWTSKHQDAGFFSRLLIVAADTDKCFPRPKAPEREALDKLVGKIRTKYQSLHAKPEVFAIDGDAETIWGEFYATFEDGPEWNRIDTYGFRLMAIQAVLLGESSVTKKNVEQVIKFLSYEVAVRKAVSPVIADNSVAQMEELIRRHLSEGEKMSRRELQRRTNYNRLGIENFDRAIRNMGSNGEIVEARGDKKRVFYMRVRNVEEDGFEPGDVNFDVIRRNEDGVAVDNCNNETGLGGSGEECHPFSGSSHGCVETIM